VIQKSIPFIIALLLSGCAEPASNYAQMTNHPSVESREDAFYDCRVAVYRRYIAEHPPFAPLILFGAVGGAVAGAAAGLATPDGAMTTSDIHPAIVDCMRARGYSHP
jgi:hypothetical protein